MGNLILDLGELLSIRSLFFLSFCLKLLITFALLLPYDIFLGTEAT
jgi:hypothetical protein